jgi:hypothetical protein
MAILQHPYICIEYSCFAFGKAAKSFGFDNLISSQEPTVSNKDTNGRQENDQMPQAHMAPTVTESGFSLTG